METDVTSALRETKNAFRDFIVSALSRKFGDEWLEKSGVPNERIDKGRKRKIIEAKRQKKGVVEERLLYYADFYDLTTILKKIGRVNLLKPLANGADSNPC